MMEVTKVVTSVFVLCLSGPSFGYPFTRSGNLFSGVGPAGGAGGERGQAEQHHLLPGHLEDYLANYVQSQGSQQQQYPQYQQQYPQYQQQQQGPYQQTKLTAETLAALLPYLSSSRLSDADGSVASSNDYAYPDYPAGSQVYTDDEGTWYDEMAGAAYQPTQQEEEQAALRLLLDHLNGRYSLDDLEAMEREAEMEENTESQLQSLMNKKVRRHEIMNDFGQGDDQHLTIRKLRETVGAVKRSSQGEKEHFDDGDDDMDDVEKELKEQESDARDNTKADGSQDSTSGVVSQVENSPTHNTGLRKRSWGQTIGHLSFWGPNRYRSHRLHRGDIGHIKFMSPF